MGDISVKGHSPILRQGFAKGGRAGHLAGGAIKVGKKFLDFIKTGKYVDKHGVKTNLPKAVERLKKQGSPHLETYKESVEKTPRIKKAVGGLTRRKRMNPLEQMGGSPKGKPHSTKEGRIASGGRRFQRMKQKAMNDYHDQMWAGKDPEKRKPHSSQEGRIATGRRNFKRFAKQAWGAKKGGKADKNWMQKVNKSIKKRGTKGKCTPITKPGCTGRAKALAKTFKKIAAKRKGKAEGGRIDVPPSSQWKKPADKNLKPGQAKDAMEQYKKQPKKLKLRCG
jgi:hypothetical protein